MPWRFILSRLTGGLDAAVGFFAEHKAARYGLYGLLLLGAGSVMGWMGRGSYGEPRVRTETVTDTVYAERTITRRDTVETTVPERVTIYRRDTVVRYRDTTVAVPISLAGSFRLARPEPIQIDGRTVTYTAYNPGPGRWTQQTYRVPPDVWAVDVGAISLGGGVVGVAPSIGIRRHDWHFQGFYGISTAGPFWGAGVSYVF